jgi:hypothetical protein
VRTMTASPSPRHPEAARPRTGLDTFVVLDHAVVALADRRFMATLDAACQLHLLASLIAQAEVWLGEQAAAARAEGMSWAAIGRLLGVTATAARQRYGACPDADARPRVRPAPREVPPLVS